MIQMAAMIFKGFREMKFRKSQKKDILTGNSKDLKRKLKEEQQQGFKEESSGQIQDNMLQL